MRTKPAITLLLLAALAACGGADKGVGPNPTPTPVPPPITVAGTWKGTAITTGGALVQFSGTFVDNAGSVTGSGTIIGGTLNCAATVAGTRTDFNLSLNWTCTGFQPINYAATLSGTKIAGNLNGSGFTNLALTMNKE